MRRHRGGGAHAPSRSKPSGPPPKKPRRQSHGPEPVLDATGAVVALARAPSAGAGSSSGGRGSSAVAPRAPAAPVAADGPPPLRFSGCAQFRQRLVYATLAKRRLRIDSVRADSETPGLQDCEASFLRLMDKLCNGMELEINETGTALRYSPGVLAGGVIEHDCGLSRSVGWFIEGLLPLLPFCKKPVSLSLTGITSDAVDWGVDALRAVVLPFLSQFGLASEGGFTLTVQARGCAPMGGGKVRLTCPVVRELSPISITDEGLVKKVRGVAFCCRTSPQVANRLGAASRPLLLTLLPDVHVFSDAMKGGEAGGSPGFGLTLMAHSTSGVTYCVQAATGAAGQVTGTGAAEAAAALTASSGAAPLGLPPVKAADDSAAIAAPGAGSSSGAAGLASGGILPEDLGAAASAALLDEIARGGCIPTALQPLAFTFMALTSEDVNRLRIGQLGPAGIAALRLLKAVFGISFRLKAETAETAAAEAAVKARADAAAAAAVAAKAAADAAKGIDRARGKGKKGKKGRNTADDAAAAAAAAAGGAGAGSGVGAKRKLGAADDDGSDDDDDGGDDSSLGDAGAAKPVGNRAAKAAARSGMSDTALPALSADVAAPRSASSVMVSCLGIGYKNTAKKVT